MISVNKMVITKKPKVLKEQNTNTCLPQVEESNNSGTNNIKLTEEDHNDMTKILDQIVGSGAPEKFKILFESPLQNCKKGLEVHQRRWDPQLISVCLALYLRSPRGYMKIFKIQVCLFYLLKGYSNIIKTKLNKPLVSMKTI